MIHATTNPSSPLLFLGHPGHELRLHDWLRINRPEVWVITDGAGSQGRPRTELSRTVITNLDCTPGPLFGRYPDSEIYTAILRADTEFFISLSRTLAAALIKGNHTTLVSDSAEGYNPSHDLCHLIACAAVHRARKQSGHEISHYDFPLEGDPRGRSPQTSEGAIAHYLTPEAVESKINVALDYARTVDGTLLKEVEQARAHYGDEIFRHERLFPVTDNDYLARFSDEAPFYEQHGEKRAKSGTYREVIRYSQHMQPIAKALQAFSNNAD